MKLTVTELATVSAAGPMSGNQQSRESQNSANSNNSSSKKNSWPFNQGQ